MGGGYIMSVLTFEQAEKAVRLIKEGKNAETFDFLTNIISINPYREDEAKIFNKGFIRGYVAAQEIMTLFMEKLEGEENDKSL
jgi:hypothetical protein